MKRSDLLRGGMLAAGALALSRNASAEEAKPAAAPPPPPPDKIHFPVLKPNEWDKAKVMAALQTKKPHKFVFQVAEPKMIVPGLASIWIHVQNTLNADEFSHGWGKGTVASAAVLYGAAIILALNDDMWAKYPLGQFGGVMGADGKPETKNTTYKAETSMSFDGDPGAGGNVYQDWSAEACLKRGSALFVCHNALTAFAGMLSMQMGLKPMDTLTDWKKNLLPGFMIVPAGVGAVHLAQEHGWKLIPLI